MSDWKPMGEYLGRTLRIAWIADLDLFELDHLDDSLLLVVFANAFAPDKKHNLLLESLVQRQPLGITVCGVGAKLAFDSLIAILSDGRKSKQIMTKYFEGDHIESAVENFLYSTWPSDDRFHEWRSYTILNVGSNVPEIEEIIKKFCD